MIKTIKRISLVFSCLLIYSFIGGFVYSAHEYVYPGGDVIWSNPNKDRGNASIGMGVGWPVSLPIWGGVEAIKWVIYDVFVPIVNVGVSAGEELINE